MFLPKFSPTITHMASITQTARGYRAQVYVKGVRDSQSFRTRREAAAWAAVRETEIRAQAGKTPAEKHTLADALNRYRDEVSPTKRGQRWEEVRIKALLASKDLPTGSPIGGITPDVLGAWRDKRMKTVSAGTVLRDLGLLSAIFESARREWRWIPVNPVKDVRKPRQPDHRQTVLTRAQIKGMLKALDYSRRPVRSVTQAVGVAFLLALRTGMRAGELCKLEWALVNDDHCTLPVTKTKPRDVPLTPKAYRLIQKMRGFDSRLVFGVSPQTLDTLFRRARDRAGLSGFVFHDARRTAATWMARNVDVLMLCRIFGWTNPKMAMVYYAPSIDDMVYKMTGSK